MTEPTALLSAVQTLVNWQAADEGLWFIARTAPEAYLQQELRRLHAAIEALATLDRERVPSLDVERLRRALDNLYERRWGPGPFPGQTTVNLEHADAIAAEYARLAAEGTDD